MAKYVEAEKAYEMLNRICDCDAEPESWADGWIAAIDVATEELDKLPAADVRPERHSYYRERVTYTYMGRLDKDRNPIFQDRVSYVCAECGRGTIVKDRFCSHCGAKMDGKGGESDGG